MTITREKTTVYTVRFKNKTRRYFTKAAAIHKLAVWMYDDNDGSGCECEPEVGYICARHDPEEEGARLAGIEAMEKELKQKGIER